MWQVQLKWGCWPEVPIVTSPIGSAATLTSYVLVAHILHIGFVQIFGSKIQNFFQTFFQNKNFFFQTRGYQMGDLTKTKNKFTYRALVVALKKTQDFLPFCQSLSLFSRLFPGLENCWANFKTFSRIQDSVWTLSIFLLRQVNEISAAYLFCWINRPNKLKNVSPLVDHGSSRLFYYIKCNHAVILSINLQPNCFVKGSI